MGLLPMSTMIASDKARMMSHIRKCSLDLDPSLLFFDDSLEIEDKYFSS